MKSAFPPAFALLGTLVPALGDDLPEADSDTLAPFPDTLPPLVIEGKAENLIGEAATASTGASSREELLARPFLRRGELLEVVPGLIATQHSGDGKANQYFVRGYNLDHGTDFGLFVDGMPANYRAHGHGQGYADINFLIPEFVERLDYQKGPFDPRLGDLTTAGAAEFSLVNSLERSFAQFTLGEDNFYRGVLGHTAAAGPGVLTFGGELNFYDGPWVLRGDSHRFNGIVRWHSGDADNFLNVTFLASDGKWTSTDQVPKRAIDSGLIPRLGFIDPTAGGESQRYSLSLNHACRSGDVAWLSNAYVGYYDLDLYSNFTYFLEDPALGDQFRQSDQRVFFGGSVATTLENRRLLGAETDYTVGLQSHNDVIWDLELARTSGRADVASIRKDDVFTGNYSLHAGARTTWNEWFRTEAGIRGDLFFFDVESDLAANSGDKLDGIIVPKLNFIFGPWSDHEYYLNLGGGFHSNDARGVFTRIDPNDGVTPVTPVDPLVRTWGAELGMRSQWAEGFTTSAALWWLHSDSELLYVGDAGNVEAGPDTNRYGLELAAYWRPNDWLGLDAELAFSEGRYDNTLATGGPWIENQVPIVLSTGLNIGRETGWFGSLRTRYFSPRPLVADKSVESRASFQVNARLGYQWENCAFYLDCLNLLDRRDNDIEYFYTSRLPGEPAAGIDDIHLHPAEPRTFRATVAWQF